MRDTIAHLAAAEDLASLALGDPAAFDAELMRLVADLDTTGDELDGTRPHARPAPTCSSGGAPVATARSRCSPSGSRRDRVPWIVGSDVGDVVRDRAAHGDVGPWRTTSHDAFGVAWVPTARLRHVADLGVRTRGNAYAVRGRDLPAGDVRVELTGPDGATWAWGESATDVVRGPAADFCLVVTQRRNVAGTALEVDRPARARVDADRPGVRGPAHRPAPRDLRAATTSGRPGR